MNLKIAFCEKYTSSELQAICQRVYSGYGRKIFELLKTSQMPRDERLELVEVEGREILEEAMRQGQGGIILTMHYGSWELANFVCPEFGYPYKTFAKNKQRYKRLTAMLNDIRQGGGDILDSEKGVREFLNALKENALVAMLSDQGGRDGVRVPFFGKEASLSIGAIRMGLKYDTPIFFSTIHASDSTHHKMIIQKPLELEKTGDLKTDIENNLKKVSALMEEAIEKYPHEYMWFYKVWKHGRDRRVTVLSDKKTGHLRQSQKALQILKKIALEKEFNFQEETIEFEFKSSTAKFFCGCIGGFFPTSFLQGRQHWLKNFLTEESFNNIKFHYADVYLSTGSSSAILNRWLSAESSAKSIHILKTGLIPQPCFDQIILPDHDVISRRKLPKNVMTSRISLNLVDQKYLERNKNELVQKYPKLKESFRPKIGVLVGGDTAKSSITEHQAKIFCHQLEQVSKELNMDFMITTSRRTSDKVEKILSNSVQKNTHGVLFISPKKNNASFVLGGILALSDLMIVSGDSVSMVSESLSSGKKTIVFYPEKKFQLLPSRDKHRYFVRSLEKKGYLAACDVRDIGEKIYQVVQSKVNIRPIEQDQKLKERLSRAFN